MENLKGLISSLRSLSLQPKSHMRQNNLLESKMQRGKSDREIPSLKKLFLPFFARSCRVVCRQHGVFVLSDCLAGNSPFDDDFQRRY